MPSTVAGQNWLMKFSNTRQSPSSTGRERKRRCTPAPVLSRAEAARDPRSTDLSVLAVPEQRVGAALELVDEDVAAGRLAVVTELDRLGDTLDVDRLQVVVDLLRGGVARLDRLDEGGRRVVALGRVDRRRGVELGLVVLGELLALLVRGAGRVDQAWAAHDGAVGVGAARTLGQAGVERAVSGQEPCGDAGLPQLLEQPARLRVVAAVEDRVRGRRLDLVDRRRVVRGLGVDDVGRDRGALALHRRSDEVGDALAVVLVVVDDEDLLRVQRAGDELADAGALDPVSGQDPVPELPALLRERHVGGRGGDAGDLALLQDGADLLRLAGERGADQADDLVLVDGLLGQRRRLLRSGLTVVGDQLDLGLRAGRVVLVDRHRCAVLRRDHDAGVLAGQVAHEADLDGGGLTATTAARRAAAAVVAATGGQNQGRRGRCGHQTPGERMPHELPPWERVGRRAQPDGHADVPAKIAHRPGGLARRCQVVTEPGHAENLGDRNAAWVTSRSRSGGVLAVRCHGRRPLSAVMSKPAASTASAMARIVVRRSIAVRWIQRNASGSVIPCSVISTPLARSTALRASSRSCRPPTSCSSATISANREVAISMVGTRSFFWNGFTR